jgi:hypothetical protein
MANLADLYPGYESPTSLRERTRPRAKDYFDSLLVSGMQRN